MYGAELAVSGRGQGSRDAGDSESEDEEEEPSTLQNGEDNEDSSSSDDEVDVDQKTSVKTLRELEWDDSTLSYWALQRLCQLQESSLRQHDGWISADQNLVSAKREV